MTKQRKMDETKFERILWRNEGSIFHARKDISRKPMGDFTVDFRMDANTGETEMQVRSWQFAELNSEKKTYKNFNGAVNGAIEYFEEIDVLVKKLPATAQFEAETAYKRILARKIKEAKEMIV